MENIKRIVLSYPKSGRTWIRIFFAIYFELIEEKQPEILFLHRHTRVPKDDRREKRILLLRNPCDVMVSYYFYMKTGKNLQITLSDFVRSNEYGMSMLKKYFVDYNKYTEDQCIIKYEDLFNFIWPKILKYFEIKINLGAVVEADKFCSFENLRKNMKILNRMPERWRYLARENGKLTKHPKDNNAHKFRVGKVGGYKNYLSTSDINYIKTFMRSTIFTIKTNRLKGALTL